MYEFLPETYVIISKVKLLLKSNRISMVARGNTASPISGINLFCFTAFVIAYFYDRNILLIKK